MYSVKENQDSVPVKLSVRSALVFPTRLSFTRTEMMFRKMPWCLDRGAAMSLVPTGTDTHQVLISTCYLKDKITNYIDGLKAVTSPAPMTYSNWLLVVSNCVTQPKCLPQTHTPLKRLRTRTPSATHLLSGSLNSTALFSGGLSFPSLCQSHLHKVL